MVTIGGATRDIMFYSAAGELISTGNLTKQKLLAFEYGAKVLADKLHFTFGGGAANAAVSFAKLGLKTAVICRVGKNDNGRQAVQNLQSKRVDISFVKIDPKNHTGFSVILTVSNIAKEHIVFSYRGANDKLKDADLPLGQINTRWFYVASLPKTGWEKVINKIVATGSNVAWNPGSSQLADIAKVKKLLPHITLFNVNRDEALEFKKLKDIKGLLKHIHDLGPKVVAITDGPNGAYAFDGQTYYYMKAKSKNRADTVGVGDAFNSAFTAAIVYKKSVKEALRWGINNSGSVITKIGAQNGLLTRRQVLR